MSAQGRKCQSTAAPASSRRPIDTARLRSALKVTALPDQKFGDDELLVFMRLETELAQSLRLKKPPALGRNGFGGRVIPSAGLKTRTPLETKPAQVGELWEINGQNGRIL
ncbi:hypothetical protein BKI51_07035 [Alphaproteobacteria bacterium AO1-B]|nr:hypothetical protein BKI51_07035 [Alphaproteobacteria bacterium AO1-B]